MHPIQFIRKKISASQLIWLKNSNNFILLEEPAWFVFRRIIKRYKTETIAVAFSKRYDISMEDSLKFVTDIRTGMLHMNKPNSNLLRRTEFPKELNQYQLMPFSDHYYRFGDSVIHFSFETRLLEYYIHPLISHQETNETSENAATFELFTSGERVVFRINGVVEGVWGKDESHLVKGLIFVKLVNAIYGRKDDFWLMTVHASAVTNRQKTILITAAAGSGKTTMSALLQNAGYYLVSDDFVPVNRHSLAFPLPIAMSVKQGSIDLLSPIFPSLAEKPLTRISWEKIVRYHFPDEQPEFSNASYPVSEFVFIKYDPSVDFEWHQLDVVNGIKLLLEQAWISPAEGIAPCLFNLLDQWSFYQLTYSNNEKAISAISNLFEYDQ